MAATRSQTRATSTEPTSKASKLAPAAKKAGRRRSPSPTLHSPSAPRRSARLAKAAPSSKDTASKAKITKRASTSKSVRKTKARAETFKAGIERGDHVSTNDSAHALPKIEEGDDEMDCSGDDEEVVPLESTDDMNCSGEEEEEAVHTEPPSVEDPTVTVITDYEVDYTGEELDEDGNYHEPYPIDETMDFSDSDESDEDDEEPKQTVQQDSAPQSPQSAISAHSTPTSQFTPSSTSIPSSQYGTDETSETAAPFPFQETENPSHSLPGEGYGNSDLNTLIDPRLFASQPAVFHPDPANFDPTLDLARAYISSSVGGPEYCIRDTETADYSQIIGSHGNNSSYGSSSTVSAQPDQWDNNFFDGNTHSGYANSAPVDYSYSQWLNASSGENSGSFYSNYAPSFDISGYGNSSLDFDGQPTNEEAGAFNFTSHVGTGVLDLESSVQDYGCGSFLPCKPLNDNTSYVYANEEFAPRQDEVVQEQRGEYPPLGPVPSIDSSSIPSLTPPIQQYAASTPRRKPRHQTCNPYSYSNRPPISKILRHLLRGGFQYINTRTENAVAAPQEKFKFEFDRTKDWNRWRRVMKEARRSKEKKGRIFGINTAMSEVRVKSGLSFTRFPGSRRAIRRKMRELLKSKRRQREPSEESEKGAFKELERVQEVEINVEDKDDTEEEDVDKEDTFEDMVAAILDLPPVSTVIEAKEQDSNEENDNGNSDVPFSLPPMLPPLSDFVDNSDPPSPLGALLPPNSPTNPPRWWKKSERIVRPHANSIRQGNLVSTFPLVQRTEEKEPPRAKKTRLTRMLNNKVNGRHPVTGRYIRRQREAPQIGQFIYWKIDRHWAQVIQEGKPEIYATGENKKTRRAHWGDLKVEFGYKEGDVILSSPLRQEIKRDE